ncbi:MAG TPA: DUF1326 domain-containing protein [Methylomirabilota bacterium]|jgi:hypothetical protein|nr:DUF1326 domain-containing protein [Methylomirabilota bacterium]
MAMAAAAWRISGEYFESCNCTVLCPCLLSRAQARPTEGHCDVVLAVRVRTGVFGATDLAGLHVALAVYTPGVMAEGNWSAAVYVDERGTAEQRDALEAIVSGRAGGPISRLAALITRRYPTKAVPITVEVEGRRRRLAIPGIADITVEGIVGAGEQEVWLDNVGHFASRRLAAAKATISRFRDHAFSFDNADRNGHYSAIEWSGG